MMKSVRLTAVTAAAVAALAGAAHAGDVTITISGVKAGEGALYVSLQTADQFMTDDAAHARVIDAPGTGDIDIVFTGVEDGDYAASVWHDDNGNQTFDFAQAGWPLDGWAMSGAATMGPPAFDIAKIAIAGDTEIALTMSYGSE